MTEAEWLRRIDALSLYDFMLDRLSVRKFRLIAVAACRTIPAKFLTAHVERWLVTAERLADSPAIVVSAKTMRRWRRELGEGRTSGPLHPDLEGALYQTGVGQARAAIIKLGYVKGSADRSEYVVHDREIADSVREIAGNPFRPVTLNPAWLTSTVTAIAAGVYHDRAFDRLPILADALQDAGCEDDDLLLHLRSAGPHVRGCWAVDLILGKG